MVILDERVIGTEIPGHTVTAERGQLVFFARATGQQSDVYVDLAAARAAGHRDLPVPPTFLFCMDMAKPTPSTLYADLGIDPRTILHGEQEFEYYTSAYAGDTLSFSTQVTDCYAKKGGALQFLVRTTEVTRAGELIAQLRSVIVVRDPRS